MTDPSDGGLLSPYTATCQTADCGNAGIGIVVWLATPDQTVFCGVCGQQISEVTPGQAG